MKVPQWPVLLTLLGTAALFTGGCASAPNYAGDLVYCDDGYAWWWCGAPGWRYVGYFGPEFGGEARLHHPPPAGELPHYHYEPGHPPPCYYLLVKGGTVLASANGRAFHDAGTIMNGQFVPAPPQALTEYIAWYHGPENLTPDGPIGGGAVRLYAPSLGQRVATSFAATFRPAGWSSSGGGGWSGSTRTSSGGGGGGGRSGGWSGGGGGGGGHSGGGSSGGGSRGGGGGGHGGGGRDR